jgi:hypothetical protein
MYTREACVRFSLNNGTSAKEGKQEGIKAHPTPPARSEISITSTEGSFLKLFRAFVRSGRLMPPSRRVNLILHSCRASSHLKQQDH